MLARQTATLLLGAFLALGCGLHCLVTAATMDSAHACCPGETDDVDLASQPDCEPAAADTHAVTLAWTAVPTDARPAEPAPIAERLAAPELPPKIPRTSAVLRL